MKACNLVSLTSPSPDFSLGRSGIHATTHDGTCTIAIIHDANSDMHNTRNRSRQYSPAVLFAIYVGKNVSTAITVAPSIGSAVLLTILYR